MGCSRMVPLGRPRIDLVGKSRVNSSRKENDEL